MNSFTIILSNYFWVIPNMFSAICNSIMDTLTHHFGSSIFKDLNANFWNALLSGNNKYINGIPSLGRKYITVLGIKIIIPSFFSDAWHPFKSAMVICLAFAVVNYHPSTVFDSQQYQYAKEYNQCLDISIFGLSWNLTFSFFYKHVWYVKPVKV